MYPDKYGAKLTKKQRRKIVDEASSIYAQIDGPKSTEVIRLTLKLYLHLGHSSRISNLWNDIQRLDGENRLKLDYSLIIKCCIDSNHIDFALEALEWMESTNNYTLHIHDRLITKLIAKSSFNLKNIIMIHRLIHNGMMTNNNVFVKTALMTAYAVLHEMDAAHKVFGSIHENDFDIICITAMMKIFVDSKQYTETLKLYDRIDGLRSLQPNHHRNLHKYDIRGNVRNLHKDDICHSLALSACSKLGDIERGKLIIQHIKSLERGSGGTNIKTVTVMIDFYGQCGDIESAWNLFRSIKDGHKDQTLYGAMMKALVINDEYEKALDLYDEYDSNASTSESVVHLMAIKAATKLKDAQKGKEIHSRTIRDVGNSSVSSQNVRIQNALISMYSSFDDISSAEKVFESIGDDEKDIVSITAMMRCYYNHDAHHKAVELYQNIDSKYISVDAHCHSLALRAYTILNDVDGANAVYIALNEYSDDIQSKVALIEFHGMNGDIESAIKVYDAIPDDMRDCNCSNAILSVLIDGHRSDMALDLYHKMIGNVSDRMMDVNTHSVALRAAANVMNLQIGHSIYDHLRRTKPEYLNVLMLTKFIDFYGICGDVESAENVFHSIDPTECDVVCIGAMMKCLINNDCNAKAVDLYRTSNRKDIALHCLAIKAFANLGDFEAAKKVIIEVEGDFGDQNDTISSDHNAVEFVSAKIYLFGKSGDLESAQHAFSSISDHRKDIVVVNNMMMALHLCGHNEECLDLWKRLDSETDLDHLRPNVVSFCNVLIGCTNGSMLEMGRSVHRKLKEKKHRWMLNDAQIMTLLINLYAACGEVEVCEETWFDLFHGEKFRGNRDVIVWNALIQAFGEHGKVKLAREVFEEVCIEENGMKLRPDRNTFVSMINIYGHCGEMDAAMDIWENRISDRVMQYDDRVIGALVDGLSRNGMINKAQHVLELCESRSLDR